MPLRNQKTRGGVDKNKIMKNIKQEIYIIIDSFLVEAKDQHGNERSVQRLNQDRHLAADALIELCRMFLEEVLPRYDPILSGIKKRADELLNNCPNSPHPNDSPCEIHNN